MLAVMRFYNFNVFILQKDNMYILDKRLSLKIKATKMMGVNRARLIIRIKEEIYCGR